VKVIQIPGHATLSICLAIWFMCNEVNVHSSCQTYLLRVFFTVDENYLHVLLGYPLPAGNGSGHCAHVSKTWCKAGKGSK
jgi:hypothetical protein